MVGGGGDEGKGRIIAESRPERRGRELRVWVEERRREVQMQW